ncbi:MAG: DUF2889 domain-containing protein [Actinomycetes bacterium]|jgi:hypothetical protein|uniref:Unannotated protein n=1 Tax=freshwater metagenome TaxID=449393 RepID=A0A6J6BQB9_9ZZZZ|nr:DUF2889 domain-containing protein [Actinomycetota bacterium]
MAFEPSAAVFDEIAPHPEGVDPADELIHERAYVVRAYRKGTSTLLLRGAVRDQKPPGLYVPTDPEPLTVHHMVVDMTIEVPSLEIVDARAVLETHPHAACPRIEDHYRHLIGLSIARGFTHKVRELFGGPRGCTHTTALLQAMAPVAIQSMWSFRVAQARESGQGSDAFANPEARQRALMMNMNTCHIWAEDGEQVRAVMNNEPMEIPVWIVNRFEKLGLDPASWRNSD